MVKASFRYGEKDYQYEICFSLSQKNKIKIHVHPNASIQVDAPDGSTLSEIHRGVLKRARWIVKNVEGNQETAKQILTREYVSGENIFYLGRRYQLKIIRDQNNNHVKLSKGYLKVTGKSDERYKIKEQVRTWYRKRSEIIINQRYLDICSSILWLEGIPPLQLYSMRKQWGSCSPKGKILINPHIIKAPTECIDYVLRHEICHLKEHNHSKKYYKLLTELMPNWKPVKAKLDGMAELILND